MQGSGTDALMEITNRPPFSMVEGYGSFLLDENGKEYLDFVQGWAVNCLGHSPPLIVDALTHQASKLINCSPAFYNEPMKELASLIAEKSHLHKVFFTNSGAEANEGAVKLARKWGEKFRNGAFEIITMEHAFHGRTLAMMSASGKPQWDRLFEPKVPGFVKVPYNDAAALKKAITEKTAAVMLEPIQGEAGVIPATEEYLNQVRSITKELGVLLIVDEIQTGIGRTGKLFACEHSGIVPDIITLGKGLGGGVPLAAMVADQKICCFEVGDQGGTFNGSPLMCAVGCAVMKEVSKASFLSHVQKTGAYLADSLKKLSTKYGLAEVRGKGLLLALNLNEEIATDVVKQAMDNALLVNAPNPKTLRFMPALTVSNDEIDQMTTILDKVLEHKLAKSATAT